MTLEVELYPNYDKNVYLIILYTDVHLYLMED